MPPPVSVAYEEHTFACHADAAPDRWRSYSAAVMQYVARIAPTGRLLDVGAASGLLVEVARAQGYEAMGIEPSSVAIATAHQRGRPVQHGYFTSGVFARQSFDLIVFQHVLEHVPSPGSLLDVAREVLRPGGRVFVIQTNFEGTVPSLLGRRWPGWVQQEHFIHFTTPGLSRLLETQGFVVEDIRYTSLGYYLYAAFGGPRVAMTVFTNTVAYLISKFRLGAPYWGDQIYLAARLPGVPS
ncbi:MAG: class I SAM-dependent methyltransferase [Dehalococcoidia bacterium]